MDEYTREPCPDRIVEDVGSAFTMGLVGSSLIYWGPKGFRNAPSPFNNRIRTMVQDIRIRSPITGVQFAAWGGVFSICDCTILKIRKKEDSVNSIIAGFITGGLLAVRSGPYVAGMSAFVGGTILAMIEGVSFLMQRWMSNFHDPTQIPKSLETIGKGDLVPA